jgi:hypothetical protein
MSRATLETAAKLLAKAQSTTSDHEAIALVERSYGLLAQVINAYDLEQGAGSRRRERRRLQERRRRRPDLVGGTLAGPVAAPTRTVDSIARYSRAVGDGSHSWHRGVDVVL